MSATGDRRSFKPFDTLAECPVEPDVSAHSVDGCRRLARALYQQGRLVAAAEAQAAVLAMAQASGTPQPDDFLFAGLVATATNRIGDAIAILQSGIALYPASASLAENLAVVLIKAGDMRAAVSACDIALSLGSNSPNIWDCLCEAYSRSGHHDLAVAAGRAALEAKDRRFGGLAPIVAIPPAPPPPFNPEQPAENVIAYALWGNAPRYQVPLLENAKIRPHLFPGWTIRLYHDDTVDPSYLAELTAHGVEARRMDRSADGPAHRGLLWRFDPIADPAVRRFLIRDADSLLTVKERVAVDAWLLSALPFHAMRDCVTHTDLLLAGLWGGVGGILPGPATLLRARTFWRMETSHLDQDLLSETVWPAIRRHVLIHDSVFQPCLGSVPFPPYGALPVGHHVGQNAFVHFSRSD